MAVTVILNAIQDLNVHNTGFRNIQYQIIMTKYIIEFVSHGRDVFQTLIVPNQDYLEGGVVEENV